MHACEIAPAARPLIGRVRVPGDKSIAHRALLLGAMARGGLTVRNLPSGGDVTSTRRVLAGLGVEIRDAGADAVIVAGREPPWTLRAPREPLECENSGTTMRLMAGILAGQPFSATLVGDASLMRRPMARVRDPLVAMGARIELAAGGRPPMVITGRRPLAPTHFVCPIPSAQVKSAVILAALQASGPSEISGQIGTRDHTERMVAWLSQGRAIEVTPDRIRIEPTPLAGARVLDVPGDVSSAAFLIAGALLVPGSDLTIAGVGLNPTRLGFLEVLAAMGARLEVTHDPMAGETWGDEPRGTLRVRGGQALVGTDVDARQAAALIDEVPILAVVMAQARGPSRLAGLGELRVKESDRLAGIAAGLARLGARVAVAGDDLRIEGGARLAGAPVATLGDHRLAMAFAIAMLGGSSPGVLDDAASVAVSYPGFFETLAALMVESAP